LATKEKVKEQKKRLIVNVMEAIEQTLPSASAAKTAIPVDAEAEAEGVVEAKDADEAEMTMSDIDRLVSDIFADVTVETNVATEETMAQCQIKEKKLIKLLRTKGTLTFGTWAIRSCSRKTGRS
jgi:hypothetical protein